jgi:sulfur-oxidizing protein SoxY
MRSGAWGWFGVLAQTGMIDWARATELSARTGFVATDLDSALTALGAATAPTTDALAIVAPEMAEDGAVVSIELRCSLPSVDRLAILAADNPNPLIAIFSLTPQVRPEMALRCRMARSSQLVALARADGRYWQARRLVQVIQGGCGV